MQPPPWIFQVSTMVQCYPWKIAGENILLLQSM